MAGLLKAIPQNLAYGLSALIDAKGGAPSAAAAEQVEAAETPAGVEEAGTPASDDATSTRRDAAEGADEDPTEPDTPEASSDVTSEPAE